jgi:glutaredoxin
MGKPHSVPMKIRKQPRKIILYSRPMCSWCQEAKVGLDERGWPCTTLNTGTDSAARQRAIDVSGQTLVPVIEVDGLVLGDFDTGQLEVFLRQHGYLE